MQEIKRCLVKLWAVVVSLNAFGKNAESAVPKKRQHEVHQKAAEGLMKAREEHQRNRELNTAERVIYKMRLKKHRESKEWREAKVSSIYSALKVIPEFKVLTLYIRALSPGARKSLYLADVGDFTISLLPNGEIAVNSTSSVKDIGVLSQFFMKDVVEARRIYSIPMLENAVLEKYKRLGKTGALETVRHADLQLMSHVKSVTFLFRDAPKIPIPKDLGDSIEILVQNIEEEKKRLGFNAAQELTRIREQIPESRIRGTPERALYKEQLTAFKKSPDWSLHRAKWIMAHVATMPEFKVLVEYMKLKEPDNISTLRLSSYEGDGDLYLTKEGHFVLGDVSTGSGYSYLTQDHFYPSVKISLPSIKRAIKTSYEMLGTNGELEITPDSGAAIFHGKQRKPPSYPSGIIDI